MVSERAAEVEPYVRCYFRHVDADDLASRSVADLFGAAVDHVRLARSWEPGTALIETLNPRAETHGWQSEHTAVMIVVDDMPFLVDTVTMEFNRRNLGIHLVVHPILLDHRDDDAFVDPADHPDSDAPAVSFIYAEIDRQTDPEVLASLREDLHRVLRDNRVVVEDWAPMRRRALDIAASLATETNPTSPENTAEVRALLDWLADNHFTFIGYREYELVTQGDDEILRSVPGTGLGILRDREGESEPRSFLQLSAHARERARQPLLLNLTKANSRATVHRQAPLDYIGVKVFGDDGVACGERRFLGLYTRSVYDRSVTEIPFVRRKVQWVLTESGFPTGAHAEKDLVAALEGYPRDELFQIDRHELFEIAMGIVKLNERRRVRLFTREDPFGRFVTCLLFLPRDRYSTEVRLAVQELLGAAYNGEVVDWDTQVSESVLARLFVVIRTASDVIPDVDRRDLEAQVGRVVRQWEDALRDELVQAIGEDLGLAKAANYATAFPAAYRHAFDSRAAVADIERLDGLKGDDVLDISVYREAGQSDSMFKLKLYRRGAPLSLTAVMPTLVNMGATVYDERPYSIDLPGEGPRWLYDFTLGCNSVTLDFEQAAGLVEELLAGVWAGTIDDDGYNELSLVAGIGPREVNVLRALGRYLKQIGIPFGQRYIQQTLVAHAATARRLVELFLARFDPARPLDDAAIEELSADIVAGIDQVVGLDEDRILRRFHNLILAVLRTSYFQRDSEGAPRPYVAFKLDPARVSDLPRPRPRSEIFVFSPRFEAVHLRSGPVARGGIRWSDRMEDYRTEILGLVKAQMVKNAVIVPAGAKGGFVLKAPPPEREALAGAGMACYSEFMSALLDLTDNRVGNEIEPPPDTVRYDGDDPYLVVAADKGTARFSDIGNLIATERGFWLGDAFASGGAHGYDHKAMGITARGAWESVKRHFREMGRDVQSEPFTAVGIGDMSGDVFGNGMLLSPHLRLIAAFDHRHVFVDPDPDPAASFAERARLYDLAGSSWADYDPELISAGGGVHARTEKEIRLGVEAREALGIEAELVTPAELIRGVLRAPVDLLWNGGIGSYVKAAAEADRDVGDKSNEGVRIDATELRCKVIGEGGNLGLTQRARIEFAGRGGRVYTDAIDNSAGVECSDYEVNIKILLEQVVRDGDLTAKQRNELLESMTDEVAGLVLSDNRSQTKAISQARRHAAGMVDVHARYLADLERQGQLDRRLEFLPDAEELADRRSAARGLAAPELAVVLAYTKNLLADQLLASTVPDDPFFDDQLLGYFPTALRERYPEQIAAHPLRREIITSRITNKIVDRGGTTMIYRLAQETAVPVAEIARGHLVAWEVLELGSLWKEVSTLDGVVDADTQTSILLEARRLAERATRWILRNRHTPIHSTSTYEELGPGVAEVTSRLAELLVGADLDAYRAAAAARIGVGVPADLAERAAGLDPATAAFDIVDVATDMGLPVDEVARAHFAIADRLDLTWLRDQILALPRDERWSTLARLTLRGDLYSAHRMLTAQVSAAGGNSMTAPQRVQAWALVNAGAVSRYERVQAEVRSMGVVDLTTLLVISRELRNLIHRAAGQPDAET